ncbi:snare-complex protein syntaxin-18 N-terminus-domain-containing protein [Dichotomocladium elegans]|nr:snare-complex protein syntaxin-18 N-terminus-domain-containing protein [Dichotomocladium elegans]
MPDLTTQFRAIVHEKASSVPPTKRKAAKRHIKSDPAYDVFTKEAYRIYEHISSLKRFLLSVRRPYLNTDTRHTLRKHPRITSQPQLEQKKLASEGSLFSLFPTDISSLTDKERDEIDFQSKVVIRRCLDRIKELDEVEHQRKQQASRSLAGLLGNLLATAGSTAGVTAEETLALHRSSITWYLNKQLTEVSELQKSQQEIRLAREIEKSENQLFRSEPPTVEWVVREQQQQAEEPPLDAVPLDAFQRELSKEQIQLLERENSTMIEELNNTLNQVRNAEKALHEISALQTQLVEHLTAQTVQTDQLYADSVATTERIEQGNMQLIKTRERNKGTRNFTLIFLLMASFVLLFLDWYS